MGQLAEFKTAGEIFPFQFQLFQNGSHIATFGEQLQGIRRMRFNGHFNEGHFEMKNIIIIYLQTDHKINKSEVSSQNTNLKI